MTLDELHDVIERSQVDDWNRIGCWGAMTGPSYLDQFSQVEQGDRVWIEHESHAEVAVLRADLDVRIAWGLYVDPSKPSYYSEAWTQGFPDTTAFAIFVDLFYRGALVDRHRFVGVDGGRYKLPQPERDTEELTPMRHVLMAYWTTPYLAALGRLITAFEGAQDFDRALGRAGIAIRDEA